MATQWIPILTAQDLGWDGEDGASAGEIFSRDSLLIEQAQLVADRQSCPNNFAYASDYIHMATMGSLKQVWAMSEPGPAGLVLGHIRLPRNRQELEHLLDVSLS